MTRRLSRTVVVFHAAICLLWNPARSVAQLWEVPPLPSIKYTQAPRGITATIWNESLNISVCRPGVIHFALTPDPPANLKPERSWVLDPRDSCPGAKFQVSQTADAVVLATASLRVELSLKWGNVQYSTTSSAVLLRERNSIPRTYQPANLNGENTFHVEDRFSPDFPEAFFGLGQHQNGTFNYRGSTVELGQNNTDVAIPFVLSSNGYGLIWNTAWLTSVDNRFPLESNLYALAGHSIDYYFIYGPEPEYESGAHAVTPLHWSQQSRTLSIRDRQGSYLEMPARIHFNVVLVSANHGSGRATAEHPDRAVEYTGKPIPVQAP